MRVGEDDKAERVQVRIGARRPGQAEMVDGLAAGQRVITHGNDKMRPGQSVRVQSLDDGTRPLAELLGAAQRFSRISPSPGRSWRPSCPCS
jgi:membrane fusion protein (multidrug efflux system)